jgi:hypothetical protein
MGTYNILQTTIACPHCNTLVNVEIEMFFGNTSMVDRFAIGDEYKWALRKSVQHGGRPEQGNIDGEGYTVCPQCQRDFFVKVMVREDKIKDVKPDMEKAAYIQASDGVSTPPSLETSHESSVAPISKSKPRVGQIGQITFNEKWKLTARIKDLLEQLVNIGVDIYSTRGGSDYTFLVPPYLSREEYEDVERLMKEVGKAVKRKVNHIDWYPHGTKYRIEGPKGS